MSFFFVVPELNETSQQATKNDPYEWMSRASSSHTLTGGRPAAAAAAARKLANQPAPAAQPHHEVRAQTSRPSRSRHHHEQSSLNWDDLGSKIEDWFESAKTPGRNQQPRSLLIS